MSDVQIDESPKTADTSARRTRRYFPGPWATLVLALCILGIVAVRLTGFPGDHAFMNVFTFLFAFIAALVLTIWFGLASAYPRGLRYAAITLVLLSLVALGAAVKIVGVSGEMIPEFRWRWTPVRDRQLQTAQGTGGEVDLRTTTRFDFPQFLGVDRNGLVGGIGLSSDWDKHPPKQLWRQSIGAGWSGFAAVNRFAVTMEQRDAEELVTCYEILTGKLRWVHSTAVRHETTMGGVGPRATPTIHDGRVYAMGATGILRCLDGATGNLLWSKDVPAEFGLGPGEDSNYVAWGRANSPLIVDDLVVVPAGGHKDKTVSLVAYDKVTGEQTWTGGDDQISYSSPVLAALNGLRQIISVNEDSVSGHDPQTGKVLWETSWPGSSVQDANTSQANIFRNSVVVTKSYGGGCKRFEVDEKGEPRELFHDTRIFKTKFTSPIVDTPFAYGLSDGILECIDLTDGQRQWKEGRYGHGQMLLVHNLLVVMSETGDLVLVAASPEKHEELARIHALDGKSWNTLCLSGTHLLVRNAQEAACFELAVRPPEPAIVRR
jgi:outer membrane protein assembly factor BamB